VDAEVEKMSHKETTYLDSNGQLVPEPVAHLHAVKIITTTYDDKGLVVGREWFNSDKTKPPMPTDEEE
jgi:hypothetical protein